MLKRILPSLLALFLSIQCCCSIQNIINRPPEPTPTKLPATLSASSTPTISPTLPSSASPTPPSSTPPANDWDDLSAFSAGLVQSQQHILNELTGTSIYHLAFTIADDMTHIQGVEEVRYTNQETVPLDGIDLALFSQVLGGGIEIGLVSMDGQPVAAQRDDGWMRVPLAVPLQPGQAVILHIDFDVIVPAEGGAYYYGVFGYNDGILSLAHAYPTILVYDQEGWNNQKPDTDGDPLFSDISFYLVSVDAPADLTLVASGREIDRKVEGDRQQVRFADGPARDFYLAAAPDWIKVSETFGEITVNSYASPEERSAARAALNTAKASIEIYSQRYAPYPYTEFDIVPIVTFAGGVEFPGMTAITNDLYGGGADSMIEMIVAHEVGHQWFYNLVGNDTQDQPWLDESLVQFVTCAYYEARYGEDSLQECEADLQSTWDWTQNKDTPIGLPVSAYSSMDYVAIVYGRGPFFFKALREQMGADVFDQFMRDYVQAYAWGIAYTEDFKQLAEQHCNCNLTPLFDEWVYQK